MAKYCLTFLILLLSISIVIAQDSPSPLLEMMNAIPDSLENREALISYIDYRAVEAARPGIASYESWSEFLTSEGTLADGLYMAALRGISSGPDFMSYIYATGELWRETVGFDFFDIDRALIYGNLPEQVVVIVGEFDTDAITSALTTLGYTSDIKGEFNLWCGKAGCENGNEMDLENRNPANIFGGYLGRQQPVIGSDTMLISSSAYSIISLSEDALSGDRYSLGDDPSYIAAVNSINPDNTLIQATFVYFTQILPNLDITAGVEILEARLEQLNDLPQYELVLIADTATDTEQVVYVTLVYSTLDDAETATELIPERLATMDSLRVKRPLHEIFEGRGVGEIIARAVVDEATDMPLAILEFHAPLASSSEEDLDSTSGLVASSQVYRLFIDMLYSRDTDWLLTGMDGS